MYPGVVPQAGERLGHFDVGTFSLWVQPSFRGRGLATRLIAAAEAEAIARELLADGPLHLRLSGARAL